MPGRKFTMVVGAVIAGAAGLAWWLRSHPLQDSVAANFANDPRPAATQISAAPEARTGIAPARRPIASASAAAVDPPNDGATEPTPVRVSAGERSMLERQFNALYEDVGAAIGTNQYETSQLIGMIVDHHFQQGEIQYDANRMIALEQRRELGREQRNDLLALLGESRLAALDEYEESIGARREVNELNFVLASTPLTEDQRRRLVRATIDAHVYYQEPQYTGVESMNVLEQERLAKMQQRDAKMQEVARGILSAEQMSALTEYQQNRRNVMEDVLRKHPD